MKFIITENKLEQVASSWMNKNFSPDQLEMVKYENNPDSIFFKKNGVVVMEQEKKISIFLFDYNEIWSFFKEFFGMENQKIREILTKWLEETLKLEGYTPIPGQLLQTELLEDTLKLK